MFKNAINRIKWIAACTLVWVSLYPLTSAGQAEGKSGVPVFEFTWSNDFFNQTDRYFSNGFDLVLYHSFMEKLPSAGLLLRSNWADNQFHGITLRQHFFTPRQLFEPAIVDGDRPYASYLMLGHQKVAMSSKRNLKLRTSIQLGLLGRYSGGESIQNGMHKLLPASRKAIGWENQLQPDLALNYALHIEKGVGSFRGVEIIPHGGFRAGIPYTDIEAGLQLRIGKFPDYFANLGFLDDNSISYYFLADVSGRYVIYNATLEGGLFTTNPYTLNELVPWVSQLKLGIGFGVKKFTVEYQQYILSPEFENGLAHKWGALTFRLAF